jgi:F0F1-type ATP synthase beta subunit
MDEQELKNKSEEFLTVLKSGSSTSHTETVMSKHIVTEKEVQSMTKDEKEELFNQIIDNGVENLTEHDKKILNLLVK